MFSGFFISIHSPIHYDSGSEEILQGSKNGCVLIRKKVYGVGARRDGWSRPLPLGAPRPMIF